MILSRNLWNSEAKRKEKHLSITVKLVAVAAFSAVVSFTPVLGNGTAFATESQFDTVQHLESPDKSRSIKAVRFEGSTAVSTLTMTAGDILELSEDSKTIVWKSQSYETIATLDATSGGRTPMNYFEVSDTTVKLHFIRERCGR